MMKGKVIHRYRTRHEQACKSSFVLIETPKL
nr:MAG TPA: hypothetical protein [Caudoviricetes sp.]